VTRLFDRIGPHHVVLVWSIWPGYRERNSRLRDWAEGNGVAPPFIHSGRHAWPEALRSLTEAIAANHAPVKVHTDAKAPGFTE
jgi:hypothetical protein